MGPNLPGHHHGPVVDEAARKQQALGDCLDGPTARFVELAERFVARSAHADRVLFRKNGTDATTVRLMVARAATGKRKVLVATKAYYGADPWCTPIPQGITPEDRAHLIHYTYNDIASLRGCRGPCGFRSGGRRLRGLRARPGHRPGAAHARVRAPCPRTVRPSRRRADPRRGARGLRAYAGGSWEIVGVRPDLSASEHVDRQWLCARGRDRRRRAARGGHARIYTTGSFWSGGVAMAAGLATIEVADAQEVVSHVQANAASASGDGIAAQSASHGVPVRQTARRRCR